MVALHPMRRRLLPDTPLGRRHAQFERIKASIRARVGHPFHIIKNILGLKKLRYRGLAKNTAQLFTLFGLANLLIAKRRLFALHAQGAS
jgi:IS5 family transposase